MFGMPAEDDGTRTDPLLCQNIITCTHFEPDFEALRAASTRIVLGCRRRVRWRDGPSRRRGRRRAARHRRPSSSRAATAGSSATSTASPASRTPSPRSSARSSPRGSPRLLPRVIRRRIRRAPRARPGPAHPIQASAPGPARASMVRSSATLDRRPTGDRPWNSASICPRSNGTASASRWTGCSRSRRPPSDSGTGRLTANDHLVYGRPWLDGPTALAAVMAAAPSVRLMTSVVAGGGPRPVRAGEEPRRDRPALGRPRGRGSRSGLVGG